MPRTVRGLVLVVTMAVVVLVAPAGASTAGALRVTLTVDQPVVTVDRDAPADVVLAYEAVVGNDGDVVVRGVLVEARLPDGVVARDVGDIAPGAETRVLLRSTIAGAAAAGGPVESVAVARSADGVEAVSPPARVDVQVISSAVYERDEPPATTEVATEVLGVMQTRPVVASTLARTGAPLGALVVFGAAFVLFGRLLLRRTTDDD